MSETFTYLGEFHGGPMDGTVEWLSAENGTVARYWDMTQELVLRDTVPDVPVPESKVWTVTARYRAAELFEVDGVYTVWYEFVRFS